MSQSTEITELAKALSELQGEIPFVKMNAVNDFLSNKYADLGAVIETARPFLAKHGFAVSQMPISHGDYIGVETILTHSSGQWLSSVIELPIGEKEKGKSLAQTAGSIISYLRRYSLAGVLGMYADEDKDGNEHGKREQGQNKPASRIIYPENLQTFKSQEGVRYVDLPTKDLEGRLIGIRTGLGKPDVTQKEIDVYGAKQDAINEIIKLRGGK